MWSKLRKVLIGVMLIVLCLGGVLVVAAAEVWSQENLRESWALALGAVGVGYAVKYLRDLRARRRIEAWLGRTTWAPARIGRVWPWRGMLDAAATVTVQRAWATEIDGFPVTAGEIRWDNGAFAGAVRPWKGRGVVVVVKLPVSGAPLAVRRPFRTIGDPDRFDVEAMRAAFEAELTSPWTVNGDELFTVEPVEGRISPDDIEAAVARALYAVRLLRFESEAPVEDQTPLG